MASIIRIKRSLVSGNPSTLAAGELAYSALTDNGSNGGDRLYIGIGTETAGNAANHMVIGGKYFTDMLDHTKGELTASSALVVDSFSKLNNLKVDNLDLNGNTISSTDTNGDLFITPNGTGKTIITNPFIGDSSTSLAEFIYDTVGGAVTGTAGQIDVTNSESSNTSVISLVDTTVTTGSYGSATAIPTFTVDSKGRLTAAGSVSISTTLSIAGDTGTDTVSLGSDTLTIAGGEGIDVAITNNTITISGEDASTTNKGVASFNSDNFTVSSGAVSTKDITLGTSTLTNGSTTTALVGLTELEVDNIRVDGNSITSTNTDGDITISPNGTGNVDVSSSRITNVAEPVADSDAATKYYVDAARSGLDIKNSVRAATTGNINPVGIQVIDGVSLSEGDRVLVKDQTNTTKNGIFVVASGAWVRSTDADSPAELNPGTFVFVEEGTVNNDCGFVVVSDGALTIGTDPIVWTLFSSSGTLIAGNGLSKNGYTLEVNTAADGGIELASDALQLKSSLAGNGLTYATGVLDIGGTADRITVNADSIDIASTYVGQTSITTLGTITTGTWSADTIAVNKGGTGLTSYSAGDLLYATGATTLTKLAAGEEGKVLQINASGLPVWGDVDGGIY